MVHCDGENLGLVIQSAENGVCRKWPLGFISYFGSRKTNSEIQNERAVDTNRKTQELDESGNGRSHAYMY